MIITAKNSPVRILVADDDAEARGFIAALVRHFHYECDVANDGHEACRMMRQKRYHLVLADINMPGNCSLEMLDAADEIAPGMPFILITASGSRETAVSAVGTQVSAYLEKPVAVDRLRKAIQKALSEREEAALQHTQLMKEVVTTLTETRQNFKSRRLGELRKKVQIALGGSTGMERKSPKKSNREVI